MAHVMPVVYRCVGRHHILFVSSGPHKPQLLCVPSKWFPGEPARRGYRSRGEDGQGSYTDVTHKSKLADMVLLRVRAGENGKAKSNVPHKVSGPASKVPLSHLVVCAPCIAEFTSFWRPKGPSLLWCPFLGQSCPRLISRVRRSRLMGAKLVLEMSSQAAIRDKTVLHDVLMNHWANLRCIVIYRGDSELI